MIGISDENATIPAQNLMPGNEHGQVKTTVRMVALSEVATSDMAGPAATSQ